MKAIDSISWNEIDDSLDLKGYAIVSQFLSPVECEELISCYEDETRYRKVINMKRYRFGMGEYKYFKYPLPSMVQNIRESFYPALSVLANRWNQQMKIEKCYPLHHQEFLKQCHLKEQVRPTPLILKYEAGGFNTLHQDLYGEIFFPFQAVIVLSEHGLDYGGGELVFMEQIPRAQSKAEVVLPGRGDVVIFTSNYKPVRGVKGFYKSKMKHGVSEVRWGRRFAMGIIFHDAR